MPAIVVRCGYLVCLACRNRALPHLQLGFSIPLSVVLIVMLRRGYSLHPNLTSIVGGLACAAAAATLLNFFHPYDATATDLSVHAFAVAFVVLANRIIGSRALADRNFLATM